MASCGPVLGGTGGGAVALQVELASLRGPVARTTVAPTQRAQHQDAVPGLVLLAAAALALVWANSPWEETYFTFWERSLGAPFAPFILEKDLRQWINDGLMALFFLLASLQIRREMHNGELASFKKAVLPVIAALGGMLAPAAIYASLNHGTAAARGWGIPMATDVAFAVGVISMLGRRAPPGLRVFLLTLAVADDLGSILVIACFYTRTLEWNAMAVAAALVAALFLLRGRRVSGLALYGAAGCALWCALQRAGIHPTIAGVALGFLMPVHRVESRLQPWVGYLILPLFALANAGVTLPLTRLGTASVTPVSLGVALGLLLGKPLGITSATWLAVRLRWGALPDGCTWAHQLGLGTLAGIGFTVSLFVANLAFDSARLICEAKAGIFAASTVAAVAGYALLGLRRPRQWTSDELPPADRVEVEAVPPGATRQCADHHRVHAARDIGSQGQHSWRRHLRQGTRS